MSTVLKNGVVVGWGNVSAIIGGVIVTGIKSIDFKVNQKKENIYGQGNEPVGRGRGQIEYPEGTLEILLEEFKALCAAAPNRDIKQIPMFNIPIVYDNNALPSETLGNVEFTANSHAYKAGDTAEWITLNFIFAGVNQ